MALSLPFAELNDGDLFFEMAHPRKKAPKFLHMVHSNKDACENINFQITEDNEDISDDLLN